MLRIVPNVRKYRAFIEYAIRTCDSFSVVFEKEDRASYFLQDQYQLIAENVFSKVSRAVHPDTGTLLDNSDICYVKVNEAIRLFLLQSSDWRDWNGESLPEDLCFYRKGVLWLSYISHEGLLHISHETMDDLLFLKNNRIVCDTISE